MGNGWDDSAQAWIDAMGDHGDWGRRQVLDPAMLEQVRDIDVARALDVGCGEGRFCRMLQEHGIETVGIDPTDTFLAEARRRDPTGDYRRGVAERLAFDDASFDLVVSYLTLIDIVDFRSAIREMTRVLEPSGTLLIANLTSFATPCADKGWVTDSDGKRLHYPLDRYLDEFSNILEWDGIRVENWHRPLSAYMSAFLDAGLQLTHFAEPEPEKEEPVRRANYRRLPWFVLMVWRKPR